MNRMERSGAMYLSSSFRNGTKAGSGVLEDDYSETSGNRAGRNRERVRFPNDGIDPRKLNGPVICYKAGERNADGKGNN